MVKNNWFTILKARFKHRKVKKSLAVILWEKSKEKEAQR